MFIPFALAASLAFSLASGADTQDHRPPPAPDFNAERDPFELDWTSPASGVWIGVRPQSARLPVTGTSVIVAGETGVLVFDGGGTRLQAERVADKVRAETGLPVTHIAISHWHGDHHLGISALREAWPEAQVVSHSFTRDVMGSTLMDSARNPEAAEPGAFRSQLDAALANPDLAAPARLWLEQALPWADLIEAQGRTARIPEIDTGFDDSMEIDLGERVVRLIHLGPGNTKGDIMLHIPDARIIAAGDAVVHPTPYGFFSYPADWAAALTRLRAFDVDLIVPGHGDAMSDWAYVDLLIETLQSIADQTAALVAEGHDLDGVRDHFDWSALEPRFTGGDPFWANRFDVWFKRPILDAAWRLETGLDNEELIPHEHGVD
ncbi:MAG: MBL fold metallo-hydrolase [Oceanicaulis sp.]|nr:MBL fold metallo-hydrolase [Oceanicaulis sp.]